MKLKHKNLVLCKDSNETYTHTHNTTVTRNGTTIPRFHK
jgi:hypothetical protein